MDAVKSSQRNFDAYISDRELWKCYLIYWRFNEISYEIDYETKKFAIYELKLRNEFDLLVMKTMTIFWV